MLHWDPLNQSETFINGRAWPADQINAFERLPSKAAAQVRKPVWDLSRNSAGLYISFKTNAKEIVIKYTVQGNKQMPHMPATGVSGLDLYAKTSKGKWIWASGKFEFADTITYRFYLQENKWGGMRL